MSPLPFQASSSTSSEPIISVIIPTYNCADFLPETIESVQSQTYPHWELLILDDGSTDNTEEAVAPYLADTRIRYTKLVKQDSCGAKVRNIGLKQATGSYVCFLDSDDLFYPDSLEVLLKPLLENSTADYTKAFFTCIDEHSEFLRTRGVHLIQLPDGGYRVPDGFQHDLYTMLDVKFSIQLATVLFRRSALERLGTFREDLSHSDDFEYFIRMAVEGQEKMVTVPAYTLKYRIRSTALTSDVSKLDALINCHIKVLNDIYAWPHLPKEAWDYKDRVFVNSYRRAARNQLNVHRPPMVFRLAKLAWNGPSINRMELAKQFWTILLQASLPIPVYFKLVAVKDWLRNRQHQTLVQA